MQFTHPPCEHASRILRSPAMIVAIALVLLAVACTKARREGPATSGPIAPIAIGDVAPAFSLPSAIGDHVSLADFTGKKPVLLYFSMGPG